jgi:hypothetical protein
MVFSLDFDSITKTSDLRELRTPITLSFSLPLAEDASVLPLSQFISRILFLTPFFPSIVFVFHLSLFFKKLIII